jgi:YHS domain-containing protein
MFKQLIFIIALVSFFGTLSFSQDKPTKDKKQKMECPQDSKNCCAGKESHGSMQIDESKETTDIQTWNKICPVTGEELESDAITFEYKGKTIGFCCKRCESKFEKDPEKYIKNLNEDGSKFIGS